MTARKTSQTAVILSGLLLVHLCDTAAVAQPPLGTLSGNMFVIADRRTTLTFTQPAGWALIQVVNNYTGAHLMKGAGYYVLGGLTPVPDGPGVAFSQAADANARLTIVQNTSEAVSFFTVGRFKRYGDGADGNLTIRRDYSYTRDSGKLTNRTQIDFEKATTVYTLSATMDLDRGFNQCGLAIREALDVLEHRDQSQPCGRGGRLSAGGEQVGELGVIVQRSELITDAEAEGALGKRGAGHTLGFFGDREVGLRVKGHGSLPCRRPIRCRVLLRLSIILS